MRNLNFDEHHVLHELKHYLPSQTPLKDFIHHNSLHAFQSQKFYDAIYKASEIFGIEVAFPVNDYRALYKNGRIRADVLSKIIKDRKGEKDFEHWKKLVLEKDFQQSFNPRVGRLRAYWKSVYKIDLDNLVQPILFRILGSYLDQGIALWHFPFEDKGLLFAIRQLEKGSYSSFFKNKRARNLLLDETITISSLLGILVGDEAYFEQYIFDQQWSHRGWSGLVASIEDNPDTVLYHKKISLKDLIILDLLLEIDALDSALGEHWNALTNQVSTPPLDLFAKVEPSERQEVLKIWQDAFEWSYYDQVFSAVKYAKLNYADKDDVTQKSFQAIFCIDEREDSLRRHLESVDTNSETLGCPGFFGVEFYFQPQNGKFYEKLCPAPVTPKYLVKEYDVKEKKKHELLYTKQSHNFVQGFFISLSLGLMAAWKLLQGLFVPKSSPAFASAFRHMNIDGQLHFENKSPDDIENGLQVGFTVEEMAVRVEGLLRGIGMVKDFAPLVYVVGHGASSANNPHHGAYDCGACSGRPGSVNARVFAAMANHPKVRALLDAGGLHIPEQTQFIGALHDTSSDEIAFYDELQISAQNRKAHEANKEAFENALDLNAKERSRRFVSIDTKQDIKKVREAIRKRSVSFFEPRPELGHSTNALCFVGHRSLTKNIFLDRRAFMNSYDYRTDLDGKRLLGVMRPLPPVCGGINLEYFFSRMDNAKMGAGTKLSHNIVGLVGVVSSCDGDLRPGLPQQMIEVHDPVRLVIMVEHYPEVILNTIRSEAALYEWFANEWVHLVSIHPDTNEFYFFRNEKFEPFKPLSDKVNKLDDIHAFLESATKMQVSHITNATKENLPVHVIER
ncbi:YbcC family protein [Emticicia sp. 21SJ11W-3]|uniref:YbcC family protein n=1 Tax=Emticicia sp. 21SJ11W-3 TaxID=2916755 RepID=UPI00209C72C0|nr:DUF2309 domain-containing protein [Emticicia sp. 21SJ11W-3]UTA69837.1 DUF2309 domain-containing protein [Emticicia sp. 21SJ11W-3]